MTPRFSIQSALGLMLLTHAVTVQAQPAATSEDAVANADSTTREVAGVEVAGPVLLELLEFIGEFTTEDGEWVDPTLLLEVDNSDAAGETRDGTTSELGAGLGTRSQEEQSAPVENCRSALCE